ncbi:MAG TPA: pilus assembly protein [Telluria sp.]
MKPASLLSLRRARGLALLSTLLLMLAAMLAGIAVARATFASVAAARYERERLIARGAAEAALLDAERDIEGSTQTARAALFTAAGAPSWPAGCGQGAHDRGLCGETSPPAWRTLDLAALDNPAVLPYGEFSGAPMALGGGLLPARLPAYLIERLAPAGGQSGGLYRITAIGFGTRATTQVVLQALYRKPDPAALQGQATRGPPATALPTGRIGWREIVNWAELHAGAAS